MMEKIKENGALIGVTVFVVFIIGFIFMSSTKIEREASDHSDEVATTLPEESATKSGSFVGTIATYDGKNTFVSYSFSLPEKATSTVEEDGAYIVSSLENAPFTKIYFSDERVRGQTSADYLHNVIAPNVQGFSLKDTEKIGDVVWQEAESATMEWHVASVLSDKWLVMVESYKKDHDEVMKTLASLKVTTTSVEKGTTVKPKDEAVQMIEQ